MGLFKKEKIVLLCNYCNEVIQGLPRARYPLSAPGKVAVFCQYLNRKMNLDNSFFEICPPIVVAKEGSKIVKYCKYCGEETNKGHSDTCAFIHGIKQNFVWGISMKDDDPAFNLFLAAGMGKMALGEQNGVLGITFKTRDKKVACRLAYEQMRFMLKRMDKSKLKGTAEWFVSKGWLTSEQAKELFSDKLPKIDFLRTLS